MPTNNAGSLADEMERLRSGNESFLPELGKMNSRAAFMDKHFDTILNALRASPSVDQGVVQEDEAFSAAVWDALKGDHNDLRKQAIILRAHRAALRRFASPQTVGEVGQLVEVLDARANGHSTIYNDYSLFAKARDTIASLTAERDAALARCEELRGALEKIATDPYQYGQRIRRMKEIARAALGEGGGR